MRNSIVWLAALLLGVAAPLAAQVPPDARWRTLETPHFRVSYTPGLDTLARRAAHRAEQAYALLADELTEPPRGRIDLLVADNVDFSNGSASALPSNRVIVYAHAPVGEAGLEFYDDWLQLLILHELVHIFHLDAAGGVWESLRSVFGRNPALFPQFLTPGWVIEGLATYYESSLSRAGRVRGTTHDMVLRTAVLEDRFFSIDRATGDPVRWPAGSTRYIYGSAFLDFVARRYGRESLPEFVEGYARHLIPYRVDAAGRRALGTSFSRAWAEWEDSLRARTRALADSLRALGLTEPEVLTGHGRGAAFPRFSPDGGTIAYSAATGRDEPEIRLILPDGSRRTASRRTSLGPVSWFPDGRELLFAQLDYVDPYRIHSDLYRVPVGGDDRRLSRRARLWDPHLHPDGRRAVVVGDAGGSNRLGVYDLEAGRVRWLTEAEMDVHWASPRYSPDGSRIAAVRWTPGGLHDVVVLDTTGAVVRHVTRDRALDTAPAWSPDGRVLVFSSDRTGIANLYALDLERDELLQVTNVLTGAFQPDVSPDGRWIAFSYYRADGYHIARIPFDPAAWRPAPPLRAEVAAPLPPAGLQRQAGGPSRPYSPWPTVLPRAWSLVGEASSILGVGVGAAVWGQDAVERHAYSAQLLALVDDFRLEGAVGYRYRGWGVPVLDLAVGQDWRVSRAADADVPTAVLRRERTAAASLLWQRRRWRSQAWLRAGAEATDRHHAWQDPAAAGDLRLRDIPLDAGATLEAGYSSARAFSLSIGPQQGVSLSGVVEGHRFLEPLPGEEEARGYLRFTGRGRGYQALPLPGFADHVLALRVDAGAETGTAGPGFGVGGASGSAPPLALDLIGGGLRFPVRGYPEGTQRGSRAVSATAEYRFPLLLVERGFRVLPLFLGRVWGDLFADAGAAWCPGGCLSPLPGADHRFRPLASVGAELSLDLQVGYGFDLPLRVGAGLPLREPHAGRPQLYLRLGRSF